MYYIVGRADAESKEMLTAIKRLKTIAVREVLLKSLSNVKLTDHDIVITVGDDTFLLEVCQLVADRGVRMLGIGPADSFLCQADSQSYRSALNLLSQGKFSTRTRSRIVVSVPGKGSYTALNDVGLFSEKSASIVSYNLSVGDRHIWADKSDGLLVSTPTGSTGYAYSAHGPITIGDPRILSITAVASLEKKGSVVVSDDSVITISNIRAQSPTMIIDGIVRVSFRPGDLVIQKSEYGARFVDFGSATGIQKKLQKRTVGSKRTLDAATSPSLKLVCSLLHYEGALTQKEIASQSSLPTRTVRYALDRLLAKKLIRRKISLTDARQSVYELV